MELSKSDLERLEKAGYRREEFSVKGKDHITRLRNIDRRCYFYNNVDKRYRVYENRPLEYYLYPVVYSVNNGIIIDDFCPMSETISEHELRTKGKILIKLLETIERSCH